MYMYTYLSMKLLCNNDEDEGDFDLSFSSEILILYTANKSRIKDKSRDNVIILARFNTINVIFC